MRAIILLLLVYSGLIDAQTTVFFEKYGGANTDRAHSVALTSDGGYIIAGSTASFGVGPSDIYLLRTDSLGDTIWTNTYGTVHFDAGFAVHQTYDGGFVVAGQLGESDTLLENLSDVFVFKTDSQGNTDWTFHWDAASGDRAFSVLQTPDSSYVVTGVLDGAINDGTPTAFLLKLNSGGDSLWTRAYESPSATNAAIQTLDGGYFLCGQYGTPPATEVYLVKTNATGDTVWTKKGGLGFLYGGGSDVIQHPDSSFIIAGTALLTGAVQNAFLSKIDKFGNLIWTKYYGGNDNDRGHSIGMVNNNGFVIAGSTHSYSTGQFTNSDIWLIRTNGNGDTLWTRSYGGIENEEGSSVKSCPDGGFVLTGYIGSQPDIFLLKTDSLGNTPIMTSVEDFPQKKNPAIIVYPNPSKGWIAIEFEERSTSTDLRFSVYDCSGRKIQQFDMSSMKADENHYRLNTGDLAKGLYFLKIDLDGTTQLTKFLKL